MLGMRGCRLGIVMPELGKYMLLNITYITLIMRI